jgi:V8-like Glu-specific endopeptidase
MANRIAKRTLLAIFFFSEVAAGQSAPPRKDIPSIAKAANGAIVSIVMSGKDGKPIAQGTGFLVSKDGIIVTNYHVIAEGTSAVVKLPDAPEKSRQGFDFGFGRFFEVDGVVAFDKVRDIAVIKAHGQNFRTVALGNSDRVEVGEEVVAIGNPLSLESTVSNGIVSARRAVQEEGGKFLQITAPISPGSSGGPLFNMAGEVIGITTMYLKGGENLNFAIPVNDAKVLLLQHPARLQSLPNEPEPKEAQKDASRKDLMHIKSYDSEDEIVTVQYGNQLIQAKITRTLSCESRPIETFDSEKDCTNIHPIAGEHVGRDIPTILYLTEHPNPDPDCAYPPLTYVIGPSAFGTITFVVEIVKKNRCSQDDKTIENEIWTIEKVAEANR